MSAVKPMRKIFSARFLSVGLGVFIAVSLLIGAAQQKAQAAETLKIVGTRASLLDAPA